MHDFYYRNIKLSISTLAFLICTIGLLAQESGTIYFNETWEICKKKQAFYYRDWKRIGDLYSIKDYYVDGGLYDAGQTKDVECDRSCY